MSAAEAEYSSAVKSFHTTLSFRAAFTIPSVWTADVEHADFFLEDETTYEKECELGVESYEIPPVLLPLAFNITQLHPEQSGV